MKMAAQTTKKNINNSARGRTVAIKAKKENPKITIPQQIAAQMSHNLTKYQGSETTVLTAYKIAFRIDN